MGGTALVLVLIAEYVNVTFCTRSSQFRRIFRRFDFWSSSGYWVPQGTHSDNMYTLEKN